MCWEENGEKCGHKITGNNTTNQETSQERASVKQVPPRKMDKPTSVQDFFATKMYNNNSPEQRTKEEGIAQWIGRTGVPARIVEDEEFIAMMAKIDKKFNVPKRH
ncbi:unnamed protein product [Arctogadus glacialis]